MTENREAAEAALSSSTVLDAGVPNEKPLSDAAFQAPPAEPVKPEEPKAPSTRETIAKVLDEVEAKDKETAAKAEKAVDDAKAKANEAKAEDKPSKARADDGKFAKTEKPEGEPEKAEQSAAEKPAAGQDGDGTRQSEGRKHVEPPARFLPEARVKWANVPNEVKTEVHRVAQEYEAEIEKGRAVAERYESIRQFDEVAKSNGRELKDSLTKVVQIEQALAKSPIVGLEMILREIGPRKQDGSPLSLHDIAQHVARLTPEQFNQNLQGALPQAQQPQQQRQASPEVAAIAQELKALKTELAQTKITPVLERFAADHADYHQLSPQIATVLKSGVIDQIYGTGLSPEQRLEQAYRMAGGQGPASRSAPEPLAAAPAPAADTDRPVDPAGQKSVRGAPASGFDPTVRRPKNNREAAAAALAEAGI